MTFNRDIVAAGAGDYKIEPKEGFLERKGKNIVGWVKLTGGEGPVDVKLASSFISCRQAQINFHREVAPLNFEQVKNNAKEIWNNELSRMKVTGGSDEQYRMAGGTLKFVMGSKPNLLWRTSAKSKPHSMSDGDLKN